MTTLTEVFASAGITHAHIVDDAYDRAPADPASDEQIQQFINRLKPPQFDDVAELLCIEARDEAIFHALGDQENLKKLFSRRTKFLPASDSLFSNFVNDRKNRQAIVSPLLKRLKECGVKCRTYGPDARDIGRDPPQLIFIDLQLRKRGNQPLSVDDALVEYDRIMKKHKQAKPFVFLFSTLKALGNHQETFRSRAKIFISQFEALDKSRLSEREELDYILRSYAGSLPRMREMHQAIDHIVSAVDTARDELRETMLSLDLVDYFVLHANTVSIEKSKLGAYVSEILMEYLTHEIEQASGFWDFAKTLDSWNLHDVPRARFGLARPVRKIYSGNMLHAPNRLASEKARLISPEEGYFSLGDIFFNTDEAESGVITKALVITTPACDLARPEELLERTILLCEGDVSDPKHLSLPQNKHGTAAVIIDHPKKAKAQLLIQWNKKRLETWHAEEINAFKDGASKWTRVGRLRPLFALQLQHTIAADLSRIGVQRTPSLIQSHGFTVFVRDGSVWKSLDEKDSNNANAAALSVSDDSKKKSAFIVTDISALRVFKALKEWLALNPDSATHEEIKNFCDLPDAVQKLLYVEQQPLPNKSYEECCYPLAKTEGLKNTKCLVYVRPEAGSPYDQVKNNRQQADGQFGSILFKFKRL